MCRFFCAWPKGLQCRFAWLLGALSAAVVAPSYGATPAATVHTEGVLVKLPFEVKKYHLPNGLRVLLAPNAKSQLVSLHLWYKVGSSSELPGQSGMAHFFEHLMFKGSRKFPKESAFDDVVRSYGGDNNAFTSMDYTGYYMTLPAGNLDKVLELEADRMQNLLMDSEKIATEREVVKSERRMRIDNNVDGQMGVEVFETLFQGTSYAWPVIGYMRDLNAARVEDFARFYKSFYVPNNAVLVLSGGFKDKQARRAIKKHFGGLQKRPLPHRTWHLGKKPQDITGKRKVWRRSVGLPRAALYFKTVPAGHPDMYALDLAADILSSGVLGRLHKLLVEDLAWAESVSAYSYTPKMSGLFSIEVRAKKKRQKLGVLISKIQSELDKLASTGVLKQELEAAKHRTVFGAVEALQTMQGRAYALAINEIVMGDYTFFMKDIESYKKVSNADIKRVARKYLSQKRRNLLQVLPK